MKYNNPPKKSKLKFLSKASDFQIVVLCEYFLMSIDPKFKRWDQSTFFNKKKNDWINEEFSDVPFSDRSAFEIDVKKLYHVTKHILRMSMPIKTTSTYSVKTFRKIN